MNTILKKRASIVAASLAMLLLASCASSPRKPEGASAARDKLIRLQSDSQLASRAPRAIREAEIAVAAAEQPQRDKELARHLVSLADQKVDIAWARANSHLLEDQRKTLSEQREAARLEARTREADLARQEAAAARSDAEIARDQADMARLDANASKQKAEFAGIDAEIARVEAENARVETQAAKMRADSLLSDAEIARREAEAARLDTDTAKQRAESAEAKAEDARRLADNAQAEAIAAKQQNAELMRQIGELNARETDRGWVITLGDVLFETGGSELKGGSANNLVKLAEFLSRYQDRSVVIEGHTDSVGSDATNINLSLRRAESVKSFLVAQGVPSSRLTTQGKGEATPVADNSSATGRQQNRRVEVIISNTTVSMR